MAKQRRKRSEPRDEPPQLPSKPRLMRRLVKRMGLLLLVSVVLVGALPTIISQTPVRDTLLGLAMPAPGWSVTSQGANLSWLGTQSLDGLAVTDPNGSEFLATERIALDRSLLELVLSQTDLGKLTVQQPTVHLVTRPESSNLEDLLAHFSAEPTSAPQATTSSSPPIAMQVEVIGGRIEARDTTTERVWSLTNANASAHVGSQFPGSLAAQLAAEISIPDQSVAGRLNLRLEQTSSAESQVQLLLDNLPLEPLQPWLARVLPGAWLNGNASSDAQVVIQTGQQGALRLQSTGRLEASQVSLQAEALAGDRLRIESLQAPWEIQLTDSDLQIRDFNLQTDWASLTAQGAFDLAELSSASLENLPRTPANLSGQVQLARLAAMLPNTLRLRQGIWIDSGDLEFQAETRASAEGPTWTANATVANVVGNDGRRAIRWEQPVEAQVVLRDSSGTPQLETVSLVSPFAEAELASSQEQVDGSFRFDLQQLSDELRKFVDLEDWQFQGRGEGALALTPGADESFRGKATLKLTELNVARQRQLIWAEPKLEISLTATGTADDLQPSEIDTAKLVLRGARDHLNGELLQPVDLGNQDAPWNFMVELTGPLASWAGRVRPWVDGIPTQVEGEAQLNAKVVMAPDYVQLVESAGRITNLQLREQSMTVNEPRVEFVGDFRLDRNTGNITSRESTFQSSTFTFRSADVAVHLGGEQLPKARGDLAFRADLERLSAAAGLIRNRDASWARGAASGHLRLSSDGNGIRSELNADVNQLAILRAGGAAAGFQPEIAWSEPELKTSANIAYQVAADRIALEKLSINGRTIRLDGAASVNNLSNSGEVEASGALQYDSDTLAQLLATYLGPEFQLQGDRQVRFNLKGQLADTDGVSAHWSKLWSASAEAGWTNGNVFGLTVGDGKLRGALKDGQLQIAPLDIAVGQGRITARPVASLSPGAEQIFLPRGPLISNVSISPEVSDAMLKYLAPIVAGATRTQGSFSLDLDQAQVPLLAPDQVHVSGKLDVHELRVTPGPILQNVANVISQLESLSSGERLLQSGIGQTDAKLLSVTDQQVQFMVSQGRVHHRDLQFLIDEVPITSNGSVGFDQTLSMEIVVPLQRKWLGNKPAFQSLQGQTVTILVGGTFQNPRIDSRAVAQLSQKLLQGAAQQAIGDELNRAFDKLFK